MNILAKILIKVLAKNSRTHLEITDHNQAGFVSEMKGHLNIQNPVNIIYHIKQTGKNIIFLLILGRPTDSPKTNNYRIRMTDEELRL